MRCRGWGQARRPQRRSRGWSDGFARGTGRWTGGGGGSWGGLGTGGGGGARGRGGRGGGAVPRLGPGAAAAAAVPVLVGRLRTGDGEVDRRVVRFLGELGTAAREAAMALRRLREEVDPESGPAPDPEEMPPDEHGDPIGFAIWRIE